MSDEHGTTCDSLIGFGPWRALAKELDVGDAIPVKWYQAVAEVLSMVYKSKKPAA